METTSLSAAAIAALVVAKALEKTGGKISENLLEQRERLGHLLKERFPTKATMIEIAEEQPLNGEQAVEIERQVEEAAKADSEVAQTVQAIADSVGSQPDCMEKFTKLAREIRMGVQEQLINHPNLNI
jgi:Na+-translocating ferredoxin:NAD+ oxidoreductase RnfG subunit